MESLRADQKKKKDLAKETNKKMTSICKTALYLKLQCLSRFMIPK